MFSHGPMSGVRRAKGLVGYIFSYVKGIKLGPGGPWPPWTPDSLLSYAMNINLCRLMQMLMFLFHQ